jgi:hypothetical protein
MPPGAEVLPALPRPERFPVMEDAQFYFEVAELLRRFVRELESVNPKSRRAILLAQALRHTERAATVLRPLAGIGES